MGKFHGPEGAVLSQAVVCLAGAGGEVAGEALGLVGADRTLGFSAWHLGPAVRVWNRSSTCISGGLALNLMIIIPRTNSIFTCRDSVVPHVGLGGEVENGPTCISEGLVLNLMIIIPRTNSIFTCRDGVVRHVGLGGEVENGSDSSCEIQFEFLNFSEGFYTF